MEVENTSIELEELEKKYNEIYPLGVAKIQSAKDYKSAGYGLRGELPLLPDNVFWLLVEQFRIELISKPYEKYGYFSKIAVHNFSLSLGEIDYEKIQLNATLENPHIRDAIVVLMFSKTWEAKGRAAAKHLESDGECYSYRGDDAWGDYIDSVPLLGEQLYNDILKNKFPAEKEKELRELAKTILSVKLSELYTDKRTGEINHQGLMTVTDHMVRTIFDGENYFVHKISEVGFNRLAEKCWRIYQKSTSE